MTEKQTAISNLNRRQRRERWLKLRSKSRDTGPEPVPNGSKLDLISFRPPPPLANPLPL